MKKSKYTEAQIIMHDMMNWDDLAGVCSAHGRRGYMSVRPEHAGEDQQAARCDIRRVNARQRCDSTPATITLRIFFTPQTYWHSNPVAARSITFLFSSSKRGNHDWCCRWRRRT